jgi:uncharacterized OB-fold protein
MTETGNEESAAQEQHDGMVPVAKCLNCGYVYGDDLEYRFPNPSVCENCGEKTENTTVADPETVRDLAGDAHAV